MAQKPIKKAPAKKAPAKKIVAKPAVTAAPVAAAPAACPQSCGCGCKCGGFGRFLKKLIVFLVIFALGFVAAKFCDHGKEFRRGMHPEFVNGCLDVTKIKCPEMAAKVAAMDTDANGCVTREEFRAAKKAMRGAGRPDCGCEKCGETPAVQQ